MYRSALKTFGSLVLSICFISSIVAQREVDDPSDCPFPFVFEFVDKDLEIGEVFCEDIFVYGFTNIESIAFSINWNPNVYKFSSCEPNAVPELNCESDNLNEEKGTYSVIWLEGILNPIDLIDQTPVFIICFEVIGDPSDEDDITISDNPTAVEILRQTEDGGTEVVDYCVVTGNKTINCGDFKAFQNVCSFGGDETTTLEFFSCGGTPPYNYSILDGEDVFLEGTIEGNLEKVEVSGLDPNTQYAIRVVDASDNVFMEDLNIEISDELKLEMVETRPILCSGGRTSIKANVTGGKEPYQYRWNTTLANEDELDKLTPGVYSVEIEDANGCQTQGEYTLTEPEALVASYEIFNQPSCLDETGIYTLSIGVTGGRENPQTGRYMYEFQKDDGSFPIWAVGGQRTITDLEPGTYFYTVKEIDNSDGFGGCRTPDTIIVELIENPKLTLEITNVASEDCDGEDGGVRFKVLPNLRNPGQAVITDMNEQVVLDTMIEDNFLINNLENGDYFITITDALGCTVDSSFTFNLTVESIPVTQDDISSTNPTCGDGMDGTITVNIPPDADNLVIDFDDGNGFVEERMATGLISGVRYDVVVRDTVLECEVGPFPVDLFFPEQLSLSGTVLNHPSCAGLDDGSIVVENLPQEADVVLLVNNEPVVGNRVENLGPGTYTVQATAEDYCESLPMDFVLEAAETIELEDASPPAVGCPGDVQTLRVNVVSGGVGPFEVYWNGDQTDSFEFETSTSGDYMVEVIDSRGCTAEIIIPYSAGEPLRYSRTDSEINPPSCGNNCDGMVVLKFDVLVSPDVIFTYEGYPGVTGNTLTNVCAGTIPIQITDPNQNCTYNDTIVIEQGADFNVDIDLNSSKIDFCFNDTGRIFLDVMGGVGPFEYTWLPDVSSSESAEGLEPGLYTITVMDANGCEEMVETELTRYDEIEYDVIDFEQPLCEGESVLTGIEPGVFGGVGEPYRYSIAANGGLMSVDSLVEIAPGRYFFRVFDSVGCQSDTTVVEVENPESITVDLGVDQNLALGDTIFIGATIGGVAPLDTIAWTTSSFLGYTCISANCDQIAVFILDSITIDTVVGSVEIFVMDENGCMDTDEISIFLDTEPVVGIPNVFDINAQEMDNRGFTIFAPRGVAGLVLLEIYDRWGSLVHQESNIALSRETRTVGSWNGNFKGDAVNTGTYVYRAVLLLSDRQTERSYKGTIHVFGDNDTN